MNSELILPKLDLEELQKKADIAAMKGATETINEFYSGYNSPYKKAIEEQLKKHELSSNIALPDIVAIINESLSREIDIIANTAISKTFIPLVQKFLTREEKEINFSDFLKEFIECTNSKDYDDYSVEITRKEKYDWLEILISCKGKEYNLTFHLDWNSKKEVVTKYQLLSLPYSEAKYQPMVKLTVEGGTIELPFTRDILQDDFMSYIARLIMANTKITMDCNHFTEEMFENDDDCHCH